MPWQRQTKPADTRGASRAGTNTSIRPHRHAPDGSAISVLLFRICVQLPRNEDSATKDGENAQQFAEGCNSDERLSDVLRKLDEPSLSNLVQDHEHHKLYQLIDQNT